MPPHRAMEGTDLQADRARNPPRRPAERPQYRARSNGFDVTPMPVVLAGFTFAKAHAFQCVADEEYTMPNNCDERTYFTKQGATAVMRIYNDLLTPKPTLLRKIAETDSEEELEKKLCLRKIKCGQLTKRASTPDISGRAPPANDPDYKPPDEFETFIVITTTKDSKQTSKKFVQAPISQGGWYAELATSRNFMYKTVLEFEVLLEDFNEDEQGDECDYDVLYGMRLEYGQRSKACVYAPGQAYNENVIKLTIGHINEHTNRLVAWKCPHPNSGDTVPDFIALKDDFAHMLFDHTKWPYPRVEDEQADDGMELDVESRARFTFEEINDRLCCLGLDKSDKETKPIQLANFCIPKVLALYQYVESIDNQPPLMKLLCRRRIKKPEHGPDRVFYLPAEEAERAPNLNGFTVLEVEAIICVCTLKSPSEVKTAFSNAHAMLQTDSLTAEQLSCYLNSIEQPLPSSVIVRFGKQKSGYFVMHNCAFKDGEVTSVEASGHAIAPAYFNRNQNLPMPTSDFPRIIIIPFKHVRYMIGLNLWNYHMPAFFQNNEQPAKAVFALAVLGLHADRCWNAEHGLNHGMPVGWVYSPEYGSGKTESCLGAHSMLGLFNRPIWAGDATKSVTAEALSMECNIMKFVDDVVPAGGFDNEHYSRHMSQETRRVYDRSERNVTGKSRMPYSGICYTANCTVNDKDQAFQSRLLTIPFKALKTNDDPESDDPALYDRFLMSRELMSALMPDLAMIGLWDNHDGCGQKLDKEALQDWAQFLNKALLKKRDRNLNEWAKLGYIFCNLNLLFQGGMLQQEAMLEWMLVTVTKTAHELTNHPGVMDQFIIHILKVKETISPNLLGPNPDKLLHWHNIRTTTIPPLSRTGESFWAIRVGKVCEVIKALTGKQFKEPELREAARESSNVVADSKSRFYDTDKNPWPIKKTIVAESVDNNQVGCVDVPLDESELMDCHLSEQRCIFIKKSYIDNIRTSLDKTGFRQDYKSIIVKSANLEEGEYNFFEALTRKGWYGYRTLSQSSFAAFCGATNLMLVDSPTTQLKIVEEVETKTQARGFESMAVCFQPDTLRQYFNYQLPSHEYLKNLPECYIKLPFKFRNAPDDEAPEEPLKAPESEESVSGSQGSSQQSEFGGVASPPQQRNGGDPPSSSSSTRDSGPVTAMSPNHGRRRRDPSLSSPLQPRDGNTPDSQQRVSKRRRTRASPNNLASYPRPPDEVNSIETARQWTAYALARGLGAAGGGISRHRRQFSSPGEAEDDDGEGKEQVCFSESNYIITADLTLS